MDELEISGKRYISAKRAGKENKYHPDYIGQLIRAGKVDGQKVGRAWYVDAESLATYLDQESGTKPTASKKEVTKLEIVETAEATLAEELEDQDNPAEKEISEAIEEKEFVRAQEFEEVQELAEAAAEESVEEIEPETAHIPIRLKTEAQKIAPPITNVFPVIPRKGAPGLKYIADEGPLFPITTRVASTAAAETADEYREPPVTITPHTKRQSRSLVRRGATMLLFGAVALTITAVVGKSLVSVVTVKSGQPASTQYALDIHSVSF